MSTDEIKLALYEFYRGPQDKHFRIRKIPSPPWFIGMCLEMQKYRDQDPTETTPSLHSGDDTSDKTAGTALRSCDKPDGERINESTCEQALGHRLHAIGLADSASEFDEGEGIHSTIEEKSSHSVGAERLKNTKAPSLIKETLAHSTGNHDSANAFLPRDSQNATPSSGDHSPRSEAKVSTCPSTGVENYAATQPERLLRGSKSEGYRNDSTGSVGLHTTIENTPSHSSSCVQDSDNTSAPSDSQNATLRSSADHSPRSESKELTFPSTGVEKCADNHSSVESGEMNRGTSSPQSSGVRDKTFLSFPSSAQVSRPIKKETDVLDSFSTSDSDSVTSENIFEDIHKRYTNIERMLESELHSKRKLVQKNEEERLKRKKSEPLNECDRCGSEINKLKSSVDCKASSSRK